MLATPKTPSARRVKGIATAGLGERADEPEPQPWESSVRGTALLARFYAKLGLPMPVFTRVWPADVPEPYNRLLVHSEDMTPTLERSYASELRLEVLSRELHAQTYLREVLLALGRSSHPVEYGAICIHLQHFPEAARRLILSEDHPFGRILETEGIGHLSWPQAFFRVTADGHMQRRLRVPEGHILYGRSNVLVNGQRRLLAEVIEILAPVPEGAALEP